jgi:hypothetical protein
VWRGFGEGDGNGRNEGLAPERELPDGGDESAVKLAQQWFGALQADEEVGAGEVVAGAGKALADPAAGAEDAVAAAVPAVAAAGRVVVRGEDTLTVDADAHAEGGEGSQ